MPSPSERGLDRFGEPYLGRVRDAQGRSVKRGGEPTLTDDERKRAAVWADAWAEYQATGSTTELENAGLIRKPDPASEATA